MLLDSTGRGGMLARAGRPLVLAGTRMISSWKEVLKWLPSLQACD
jgi:hypothetical protein